MNYILTDTSLHVEDSYTLNKRKDIRLFLESIKSHNNVSLFNRNITSLINEWKGHNLLYNLHLFRSHTKDVDLEYPQKWYYIIIWNIIGLL